MKRRFNISTRFQHFSPSKLADAGAFCLSRAKVIATVASLLASTALASIANPALPWPPQLNQKYPDLQLTDASGKKIQLTKYAGRVILLEPIGMSCPACQAFVGASEHGAYPGCSSQQGLPSIEATLRQNGIEPNDTRLVRIQVLLYSPEMTAPTLAQTQTWAKHFGFGKNPNEVLLFGDASYIGSAAYNLIPGFQLLDRNFVLRCDATGHRPKNDLYRELVPMIKGLL